MERSDWRNEAVHKKSSFTEFSINHLLNLTVDTDLNDDVIAPTSDETGTVIILLHRVFTSTFQ